MGTRSAIAIRTEAQGVKASYNHYDGYPNGVGADLQKELSSIDNLQDLKAKAESMLWVNAQDNPSAEDRKAFGEFLDTSVSNGRDWYSLLRDQHGSLLKRLNSGIATDESDFPRDRLFCEWCYMFDFVDDKVEILRGFNQKLDDEHLLFKADPDPSWKPAYEGQEQYFGVKSFWKGTLAEFKALDMEALEAS